MCCRKLTKPSFLLGDLKKNRLRGLKLCKVLLLASPILLTACSGNPHSDLVAFIDKIKTKKHGTIQPLPEVKPYETFVYDDVDRRDPFSPFVEEVHSNEPINDGLRPDQDRKREALEEFPLDSLKYVGTLEKKGTMWALVSAPDNTVYRVQVGNHMGTNFGEILQISETEIALKEIIPNGATGGWLDRDASLSLAE